mmetsp:Transcript_7296/g.11209  ORF Transcript_7296/g.11209 Transcript_7296/m.11209 type:complete len:91 (-) Transcript_7296:34-306(-)
MLLLEPIHGVTATSKPTGEPAFRVIVVLNSGSDANGILTPRNHVVRQVLEVMLFLSNYRDRHSPYPICVSTLMNRRAFTWWNAGVDNLVC